MDRRALPVLLVLVVALVGTGVAVVGGDDEQAAAGQATAAQPASAAATPASAVGSSGIVEVVIEQTNNPIFDLIPVELNGVSLAGQFDERNENNLDEPLTIPAGEIRFVLRNVGTLAHNFQVRLLDGTNLKKTKNVGPKKTGELVITLEPGNYLIACPISDHDKRGMVRTLVVTAAGE
jgi:uncharacterized cupredoxin-like copper-binding protein